MKKRKLNIEEQILDMQKKGITFNHTNLKDACQYLEYNNYYFKLKSYTKNYDKYTSTLKKGKYINLDFSYLHELSSIDTSLRKIILLMALDIEHALKTRLLRDLSENAEEDGYNIVKQYFSFDYIRIKNLHNKVGNSVTSDLVKKRQENEDNYALWELVEVISFGEFISLYQLYYSTYPPKDKDFSNYLWAIKFLRNAAAHNNCLLNSLKAPYNVKIHKTKDIQFEISKIKTISQNTREKRMSNPIIHDFVILVYVYLTLIKDTATKKAGINQIHWLFNERMLIHKDYFEKNLVIIESYRFVVRIVNYFCNKYGR